VARQVGLPVDACKERAGQLVEEHQRRLASQLHQQRVERLASGGLAPLAPSIHPGPAGELRVEPLHAPVAAPAAAAAATRHADLVPLPPSPEHWQRSRGSSPAPLGIFPSGTPRLPSAGRSLANSRAASISGDDTDAGTQMANPAWLGSCNADPGRALPTRWRDTPRAEDPLTRSQLHAYIMGLNLKGMDESGVKETDESASSSPP